jgi:PAS domain S-box-containing protein
MPSPSDEPPGTAAPSTEAWDAAPCGLLNIDADGLVLSANRRLLERLGYTAAELVGRMSWDDVLSVGSRVFWHTQLAPVLELDGALEEIMVDLRGADGQRRPALLNAVRVSDRSGHAAGAMIAVMVVPDRRAYENELRQARASAELAQAAERHTRMRLERLARASVALASSAEVEVALNRLARALAVELADWCLIYATDAERPADPSAWAAAHVDPGQQQALERLAQLLPQHASPESEFTRVLNGAAPVLLTHVTPAHQQAATDSPEVLALFERLTIGSAVVVPSTARGTRVATMVLVRGPDHPAFSADDLADLTDLAARAGIAIDNLRQRAREHRNSVTLQHALLTAPPDGHGLEIVTRYLPAAAGNEVGGDWHDAFHQSDGTPVLVIGDVVGHDIHAAAAMGQLRGVLRTLGYPRDAAPADILTATDRTARGLGVDVLASAFVARLERHPGGGTLQWSNAGHPPPLLMSATGGVRLLDAAPDPILGLTEVWPRHDHTVELSTGDILLLYTDGLVEQVTDVIDIGIRTLAERMSTGRDLSLEELCDLILIEHQTDRRDDIAMLLLRVRA